MSEAIYLHAIHYCDPYFELLCFTETESKIIRIHDFGLHFYVEYDPQIEGFVQQKFGHGLMEVVHLRKMFMYHPEATKLIKISAPSQRKLYYVRAALRREFAQRKNFLHTWEDSVDPVLRFIQVTGKTIGKWYRWPISPTPSMRDVDRATLIDMSEGEMFMTHPRHLVTASFDIETSGLSPQRHTIHTIGMVLRNGDGSYQRRYCLHLHQIECKEEEEDNVEFVACASEQSMLMEFQRIMQREYVSVTLGFNISGFDWNFLFERARILNVSREFFRLSWWYPDAEAELVEARLRGYKDRKTISIPGVHSIDVMILAKEQMKLDSYSLNAVAMEALGGQTPGNQKHEVELKDMLSCGEESCLPETRYLVGLYCIQDCDLVLRISGVRDYVNIVYESSSRGFVTPHVSLYNGITRKITSLLMHHARNKGFLFNIPRVDYDKEDVEEDKYKGGFVVDPKLGCHGPVIILDFASLYPSQVLQYTLCPSQELTPEQVAEMPPEMVRTVCLDEDTNDSFHYLRIAPTISETVVPFIEEGLYADRAYWKKIMKTYEPGTPGYKCADANQLSVKVLMNAIYGAMAIISRKIAECITAKGRQTIKESIQQVIQHFDATLIYGDTDSMMVTLPDVTSIATQEEREYAFQRAKDIGQFVTQYWLEQSTPRREHPIVALEAEAIVYGFWQGKKMYALQKWEKPSQEKPKFVTKGLTPGRRDSPAFVRQAVKRFLLSLVDRDFATCLELVRGVIKYIQKHCDEPPSEQALIDFSMSCNFGQEEYDNATGAVIVVNRRRSREYDTERFSVTSGFEIGDRVPFVAISPDTREPLRFHILKISGLPVGFKISIDGVRGIIPPPGEDGWQIIGLKKKITFGPDPKSREHRSTTIRIDGLCPAECRSLKKESAYMDGVSAHRVEWINSVKTGEPQLQIVFRVTEGSIALRAEDIPYVNPQKGHRLDYAYYLRRFSSPIEGAIQAIHASGAITPDLNKIFYACENAKNRKGKRQSVMDSFMTSENKKFKSSLY